MNISLTPELDDYVREQVEIGNYDNNSDVIEEALRVMQEQRENTIQELRQKLIESEQSGIAENFSFERLKKKVDVRMAAEREKVCINT